MLDQGIEKGSSFIRMRLSLFGIARDVRLGWSSTDLLTGTAVDAQPSIDQKV
jgi:hypothetical protein